MTNGIKPVLDLIDPQLSGPDRPLWSDVIVEISMLAPVNFKQYVCGVACSATGHALAVVRSVYPLVKLERIDDGFAQNLSDKQITALEEEVSELAIKLADDLVLFGDANKQP